MLSKYKLDEKREEGSHYDFEYYIDIFKVIEILKKLGIELNEITRYNPNMTLSEMMCEFHILPIDSDEKKDEKRKQAEFIAGILANPKFNLKTIKDVFLIKDWKEVWKAISNEQYGNHEDIGKVRDLILEMMRDIRQKAYDVVFHMYLPRIEKCFR